MIATLPMERARARTPDPWIVALVAVLATCGVLMSASARVYDEALRTGVPLGIARSLLHLGLGLLAAAAMLIPDYRQLVRREVAWLILVGTCVMLLAARLGPEIGNTHRWIRIGGFSIQPSELAKLSLVLVVAAALVRSGDEIRTLGGLFRPLAAGGAIAFMVLIGKDLGTPVLMFGTTVVLCLAAGARYLHIAGLMGLGAIGGAIAVWAEPYRVGRVLGFVQALNFEPSEIPSIPYQLRQSLLAIGSGGPFGKGFGASTQKAFFLPEADNDFIFAVIAEELGLPGTLLVLGAFMLLAWRGIKVAQEAPDELGRLIALGCTWFLCGQALCHMGVVTGLLPTKGLTLPFFSTGGWSLITSLAMTGLLLNISVRRRPRA